MENQIWRQFKIAFDGPENQWRFETLLRKEPLGKWLYLNIGNVKRYQIVENELL